MDYVYALLEDELQSLTSRIEAEADLQCKAETIGNKNLVAYALKLLRKCDASGVSPGRVFTVLPGQLCRTPSSSYRVCEDNESDNRSHWVEVDIDGKRLELHEGDVVIHSGFG